MEDLKITQVKVIDQEDSTLKNLILNLENSIKVGEENNNIEIATDDEIKSLFQ